MQPAESTLSSRTSPIVPTLAQSFNFDEVALAANPRRVGPGGQVTVSWLVQGPRSGSDWIGLFKTGTPNDDYTEGWWEYTAGRPSGTFTFTFATAPEGQYEFRYLANDGYVDAARSGPITVSAAP